MATTTSRMIILSVLSAFLVFNLIYICYHTYNKSAVRTFFPHHGCGPKRTNSTTRAGKEVVVASSKNDDVAWFLEDLPDWKSSIYVLDDPQASVAVPLDQGRESMAYLTYIIDNYHNLPEFIVFMHTGRYQWHGDDPNYDAAYTIQNLPLHNLRESGYLNLHCTWWIGCPNEKSLVKTGPDVETSVAAKYAQAFVRQFWGEELYPLLVPASCCAQFAVTGETVRRRSLEDYEKYRAWLAGMSLF